MTQTNDPFLQRLIARLKKPGVVGIALVGSYARGENSHFSDVDVDIFVSNHDTAALRLELIEGRLVSIKQIHIDKQRAELHNPKNAVWAVPGLRQMMILLDESGQLSALKTEAENFKWEIMQASADRYAEEELMGAAEEVHKILGGLAQKNESKVLYAVWGLLKNLVHAVAVQKGLMIDSENRYFDLIQNSMKQLPAWVRAFRGALGAEHEPGMPVYQTRGRSALALYRETAQHFKDIIHEHREVIHHALQLIEEHLKDE